MIFAIFFRNKHDEAKIFCREKKKKWLCAFATIGTDVGTETGNEEGENHRAV
ncbi:hypothetical protein [Bartonella sp. AU18XJBT]|uniref:hypothetical protein n=1 Tax=Bartonella sp. AU18XJBT TaxID=3019089 RepID=UPI00235F69F2|nr:hypothetical protein [Bartonella sp. AU18XJBT]